MDTNLILATDSYKLGHWKQYPKGTTGVYSYFEAREGAKHDATLFFGLQSILRDLEGSVVTGADFSVAKMVAQVHFGTPDLFNRKGWSHILTKHNGRLPVRIKAVPEGTVVPVGNVLMTVENTDPECFWLTNALESLLTHVWYPTTVATQSYAVKQLIKNKLEAAGAPLDGLQFMLHDFGYRGASSHETAAIGGAAHLVNFVGTDTLPAMELAMRDYSTDLSTLGFSVPATEHSVMTARGERGEYRVVSDLIDTHPAGILSVVADSYDIYEFVKQVGFTFKDRILARDGVFVVRPDSVTQAHPYPATLVTWILEQLWHDFGGDTNAKGFKVLDPHVRVLWGDGISPEDIEKIIDRAMLNGFSPENLVFGMGGGLLQKVNRDTERFAFKSSAQQRNGEWHDVYKVTPGKNSKRGRLKLAQKDGEWLTVRQDDGSLESTLPDELVTVFENGEIVNPTTFEEVRARANA